MYILKSKIREADVLHDQRASIGEYITVSYSQPPNTEERVLSSNPENSQKNSNGTYRPSIPEHRDNKEGEKYISRQPLVGDKLVTVIIVYDQLEHIERFKFIDNLNFRSYITWTKDHRDNKEEIPHISRRGVGMDNQSINDRDKNRVTKKGKAIKRHDNRRSKISSGLNETSDTRMDCYYNRGEQFDIARKNDLEYELQLNRVWNCSYRFNNLPISSLLCTRPLIIITNTTEEYALEGQTKGRNLQREDTYIEDQTLKLLKVKPIEEKYNGGKQKQTLLCGMCIQHHEALYFCTTCKLYICCRCHRFHKEVWIMMKHVIHLVSENTAA